jgi:hypothetical protein
LSRASAGLQDIKIVLIDSRADRLDELQARRFLEQMILPEARHHDDIRFCDPAFELLEALGLETLDTGVERIECRLHLICGMSEADHQIFTGWKGHSIFS